MIGLINNCLLEFLRHRFGDEGMGIILDAANLPRSASFNSSCPFADDITYRCSYGTDNALATHVC